MLHTFEIRPNEEDMTLQEFPSTSGSSEPPHGLDMAKVTTVYNALLQVCSCYPNRPTLTLE